MTELAYPASPAAAPLTAVAPEEKAEVAVPVPASVPVPAAEAPEATPGAEAPGAPWALRAPEAPSDSRPLDMGDW